MDSTIKGWYEEFKEDKEEINPFTLTIDKDL